MLKINQQKESDMCICNNKIYMVGLCRICCLRINYSLRLTHLAILPCTTCVLIILHTFLCSFQQSLMETRSWIEKANWVTHLWTWQVCIVRSSMWRCWRRRELLIMAMWIIGQFRERIHQTGQVKYTLTKNN